MKCVAARVLAIALSVLALASGSQIEESANAPTLRGNRRLQDQTCSNGLPGFDGFNSLGSVCCPISCGQCGLPGCGSDGNDRTECCVSGVLETQPLCTDSNAAPCVIVAQDGTCSNGYAGFEGVSDMGVACCPLDCGFCGGATCADDGRRRECCVNGVINNQPDCLDTDAAPCRITPTTATPSPEGSTPAPTTDLQTPSPSTSENIPCSNGFEGFGGVNENGEACCPLSCGLCGGLLCSAEGRDNTACCINGVLNNQDVCSDDNAAPCRIIASTPSPTPSTGPTPSPSTAFPSTPSPVAEGGPCSNGFEGFGGVNENGEACCPLDCGFCGGDACGAGGRNTECCINGVLNNQDECSDTNPAPCKITGAQTPSPTQSTGPTPSPSTAFPSTPSPVAVGGPCSNGFEGFGGVNENGEACCPLDCGFCGGDACGAGGRNKECCINGVLNNQDECSDTNPAPCKIVEDSQTPAPVSFPLGYLGCYKDEKTAAPVPVPDPARIFSVRAGISSDGMSAQACFALCETQSGPFDFYGTQFGRECWCGVGTPADTYLRYNNGMALADTECDTPCTGNAAETCGGRDVMSVYAAVGGL